MLPALVNTAPYTDLYFFHTVCDVKPAPYLNPGVTVNLTPTYTFLRTRTGSQTVAFDKSVYSNYIYYCPLKKFTFAETT